jgi:hypothetical protein
MLEYSKIRKQKRRFLSLTGLTDKEGGVVRLSHPQPKEA